jgi:hypothetical protein
MRNQLRHNMTEHCEYYWPYAVFDFAGFLV